MASNYASGTFEPLIPADLFIESDKQLLEALGVSIGLEKNGFLYLFNENYTTSGYIEAGDGSKKKVGEDDLYLMFQELIKRSEGRLLWVSHEQAYTCDMMRRGEFGGSAVFITADDIQHSGTSSWLERRIHEAESGDIGPDAEDFEPVASTPSESKELSKAESLLRYILVRFPQADPESEIYEEEIDGSEAVDFISEIVPEIRKILAENNVQENRAANALKSAWDFIENVTDEDPERNDKFFALRKKVRNALWDLESPVPILAIVLEGGLVQSVITDQPQLFPPSLEVVVIDYDTEGADSDEIQVVPQADGTMSDACCRLETLEPATVDLHCILDQVVKPI